MEQIERIKSFIRAARQKLSSAQFWVRCGEDSLWIPEDVAEKFREKLEEIDEALASALGQPPNNFVYIRDDD